MLMTVNRYSKTIVIPFGAELSKPFQLALCIETNSYNILSAGIWLCTRSICDISYTETRYINITVQFVDRHRVRNIGFGRAQLFNPLLVAVWIEFCQINIFLAFMQTRAIAIKITPGIANNIGVTKYIGIDPESRIVVGNAILSEPLHFAIHIEFHQKGIIAISLVLILAFTRMYFLTTKNLIIIRIEIAPNLPRDIQKTLAIDRDCDSKIFAWRAKLPYPLCLSFGIEFHHIDIPSALINPRTITIQITTGIAGYIEIPLFIINTEISSFSCRGAELLDSIPIEMTILR